MLNSSIQLISTDRDSPSKRTHSIRLRKRFANFQIPKCRTCEVFVGNSTAPLFGNRRVWHRPRQPPRFWIVFAFKRGLNCNTMASEVPSSSSSEIQAAAAAAAAAESEASVAQQNWELVNEIKPVDQIYRYNAEDQRIIRNTRPWTRDPHYFKDVKISALALLKMVIHARSGGNLEIMGLMQGKIEDRSMIVMDSFALPVEGTETRVNAQAQAYEYMTTFTEACQEVGREDLVIGWYHSHPGYGCWLSGIDVSTQSLNQQFQEPFVAVVIDPVRTISAGKVDIGAFRTYPRGFQPSDEAPSEYQSVPLNKIEDFGVHCKQYYSLEVSYFKSSLDTKMLEALWNTYWVNTLASNALLSNSAYMSSQIVDLSKKLNQVNRKNLTSDKLSKCVKDGAKVGHEIMHGLMCHALKNALFAAKGVDGVDNLVEMAENQNGADVSMEE
ncbi:hypothetical protein L596_015148 [Steinernema carpocapsae]|uniref:MPN domain-containing protein n=2 Tax=Steinernema carpocapsae TaxID=34508 RepID=A0A4U5NEP3_STECR|nr:hypothetical protein L596_015148 [Steinernema carpocapsae]